MRIFFLLILLEIGHLATSQSWIPVGSPTAGTNGSVRTMVVYNNDLIVGGEFTTAGNVVTNRIAMWNGLSWSNPFGLGFEYSPIISLSSVQSMCEYNGDLIVAGKFTTVSGITAYGLAKWDGNNWSSFSLTQIFTGIQTMTVYNGELYVGGQFDYPIGGASHIAKWNGSTWASVETGLTTSNIKQLYVYNGELYASGNITSPGNYVARFNGSYWSTVGLNGLPNQTTIEEYNSKLYLAVTTGTVNFLYEFDGITLSLVPTGTITSSGTINMKKYQGNLVITGLMDNGVFGPFFYNGSNFTAISLMQTLTTLSMAEFGTNLYVGWPITTLNDGYYHIAKLDGMVGIDEVNEITTLKTFPNPTSEILLIKDISPKTIVQLYNLQGQILIETEYKNGINIEHLNSGTYVLRVIQETKPSLATIVIKD